MKNCRRAVAVLLMLVLLSPVFFIQPARADIVTDTLTVKVGYFGMLPEEYVEIGTYQWWELEESLPLHEETYSFFRSDALNRPDEMRTVVDSARGFYLTDLLDFANIYIGDVSSLSFYTRDQEVGSFVSFTAQELFRHDRFYFENLAMHLRNPYHDASGKLVYDDSEAWDYARVVEPMLALEDNWANFEISNNETPPNFDGLHAGNRFRLLFGQHEPQATETSKSAKYVHTVLVTLSGTAIYVPEPPELDGTIGSHEVKMNITVSNDDLLRALQSILGYVSSDESVLKVTGWSIDYSDTASDLATVTIRYDVLTEGDATINGVIGTNGTPVSGVKTGSTAPKEPDRPEPVDPGGDGTGDDADVPDGAQIVATPDGLPGLRVELSEKDRQLLAQSEAVAAPRLVIPLTPELAAMLRSEPSAKSDEEIPEDTATGAERTALEVAAPERQTKYLAETGIAALVLLLAGGLCEALTFRKERGKKL